ncbi:beta-lactamase-like protein [Striga asiatica]|uniref:Beta-lactamase-like protein n=1 Tax=Striga asiatica TaxID=4170 RepID=A0A5A7Q6F4_STRAF|nr:beta-lactamase-like protein [Striga asiatica]
MRSVTPGTMHAQSLGCRVTVPHENLACCSSSVTEGHRSPSHSLFATQLWPALGQAPTGQQGVVRGPCAPATREIVEYRLAVGVGAVDVHKVNQNAGDQVPVVDIPFEKSKRLTTWLRQLPLQNP